MPKITKMLSPSAARSKGLLIHDPFEETARLEILKEQVLFGNFFEEHFLVDPLF